MKRTLKTTVSLFAASMLASAGLMLPVSAAPSEAAATLGTLSSASGASSAASTLLPAADEVQAVWISYLDLMGMAGDGKAAFTAGVKEMFDDCADAGLNTVIVQVRPYGDSFYPSEYFPWSSYASGSFDLDPGYDPLSIMVKEAHKAGLDIEAWVNPLRLMTPVEMEKLSDDWLLKEWYDNGENIFLYGGRLYLDPASEEARELVCAGVAEIAENYDVDGIHIDDYFYPTSMPMSVDADAYEASGTKLSQADWRRENIDLLVADIYDTVKEADEALIFGVSPRGIIEQCENLVYANVTRWASEEGFCDYLAPQIYYGFEHSTAAYNKQIYQWSRLTTAEGVSLRIGLAAYKVGTVDGYAGSGKEEWVNNRNILSKQLNLSRQYANVEGTILFRYEQVFGAPSDAMKIEMKNFTALIQ